MRSRSLLISGVLLAELVLAQGLLWPAEKKTEPAATTLDVTYYYLPG